MSGVCHTLGKRARRGGFCPPGDGVETILNVMISHWKVPSRELWDKVFMTALYLCTTVQRGLWQSKVKAERPARKLLLAVGVRGDDHGDRVNRSKTEFTGRKCSVNTY